MYSWKTIRTICAVLLLLPIVHLVYLVSNDALATLDASPTVWAPEIDAYARTDRASQLPRNPIVVVGGRRVRLWRGLEDMLAPKHVLMRGLGNAIVNDILYYYEPLIGYYRPHTVVLLPSNTEFHVRDMKSAAELVAGIRELVKRDAAHGVTRRFYVFAPLKSPLYPQDSERIAEATRLLHRWADTDERVVLLDANPLLTRGNGSAKPDFYRSDGVNLNEHGYLRLSLLLQQQLEKDADLWPAPTAH